ncbi:phosphatidic acid phosphatase protein-like protein [Leptomonas pyrrhocoris]|uniref:Phosphatidic acid phosphatase protein-like protein n=1 Tax=Leptomonas pyrrhocoris TaxID=157538 RepID=A0A0N0DXG1_LEPPY|nr:phosphatidic acid phosphatase protein-like protein [Leptomonas pyrrhocoris]XP_015661352.1 phosphatidic acid phosphatase protein-like protein [Leptomonas pyrrhocoris]XP_015661353.1 phosphatidic acid phosphatase protein-like protein [Leptomonas pyrrhocoris]KPA82912.1 phosphatidic acid phosphatase protein-like protein [Leptomonas pyrrhocoris]KPA82913.1 phosphatidic acid phosphatase protein-like protein [Leptomonas pyrrhocoris]KPA82914.1 phosphatidic acid phosphatase protein-like protein [Lepto|eukprot:XP_015661351.1 phosphatidic acid phosphatase protein-like protein [Leptomonas pyrrhocoris]
MAFFTRDDFVYVWNSYHVLDWIILAALNIIAGFVTLAVQPHCRPFSWDDATINYPVHPDTFPNYSLVLMVFLAIAFYIVFVLYLVKPLQRLVGEPMEWYALGSKNSGGSASPYIDIDAQDGNSKRFRVADLQTGGGPLYPWLRAHLWAVGLEFCMMAVLKVYAGSLRPDYLDRLKTAGYTRSVKSLPDPKSEPEFYCKLMDSHPDLKEGRLSFPSGHSSTSFAVFTVMSFFFVAYLRPFARQASFTRLLICLCPLIVPTICAVSRTRDYKHHFSDIVAGALIGIACALMAFYGSFRQVGGAAGIYFCRTAADVDYDQLRESASGTAAVPGVSSSTVDFGATQQREHVELRKSGSSPTVRRAGDSTVLMSDAQRGSPVLTERKLNEDPAAVPWI